MTTSSLLTANTIAELRDAIGRARAAGQTIGVVPTMGAMHEGHLSLVEAAQDECDLVVTTLFVNPTQFAPGEDYDRYPRDLEADAEKLASAGCDLLFAPAVDDIYPAGCETTVDIGSVATVLEGAIRPTHFRGVATVVLKLLNLTSADRAYFGQKDYQQTVVVRQMVRDFNVPTEIRVCPTIRDPDGLAMSSRNAYLSADQREQGLALSGALRRAEQLAAAGETSIEAIRTAMEETAAAAGIEFEYVAFLRDGTVEPVDSIAGPTVVALAARVGETRLIDNCSLGFQPENR